VGFLAVLDKIATGLQLSAKTSEGASYLHGSISLCLYVMIVSLDLTGYSWIKKTKDENG